MTVNGEAGWSLVPCQPLNIQEIGTAARDSYRIFWEEYVKPMSE
jgi:hypothetical protein